MWWWFQMRNFQSRSSDYFPEHFQCFSLSLNGTGPYWPQVNIGSGNGLLPSGNKPLPEPMLTKYYVAICRHMSPMSPFFSLATDVYTTLWCPFSEINMFNHCSSSTRPRLDIFTNFLPPHMFALSEIFHSDASSAIKHMISLVTMVNAFM